MGLALVAGLVRYALTPWVGAGVPFIAFFPAVLIASLVAGPLSGVSAVIVSSWIGTYFIADIGVSPAPALSPLERILGFWFVCSLLIAIAALTRALVQIAALSEERALLLAHETSHRARNVLGLVHAVARQSFRRAASLNDFMDQFEEQLAALGEAQEVLSNYSEPPDLRDLLGRIIRPFDPERFHIEGEPVGVSQEHATALTLVIHELCTNATKHGSLSVADGAVNISWSQEPRSLKIQWREIKGPPVVRPELQGFGSRLLKSAFPPNRGAIVANYEPDGLICLITLQTGRHGL